MQLRRRGTGGIRRSVPWLVASSAMTLLLAAAPAPAENPCLDCHEEQIDALHGGPHRGVANEGARFCESCHGDGAAHMASGEASDIIGVDDLAAWTVVRESHACLSCHAAEFPAYQEVAHSGRVSCWSCHAEDALHGFVAKNDAGAADRHRTWELCTSCHPAVKSEFKLQYRHPVEAGLVDCSDCHDTHGRQPVEAVERLQVGSSCLSCHKDLAGPYIFEHLAMDQGSGCVNCHRPHGSWNRGLLVSTGNGTCLTCHLQSNFPGVGKIPHDFRLSGGATCWSCHSDVHGSNTTPDLNPRGRR